MNRLRKHTKQLADALLSQIRRKSRPALQLERLETRDLLSGATPFVAAIPSVTYSASSGYSPSQIRSAYGINTVKFSGTLGTGAGQTIAIVDAYNDPTIVQDLAKFDSTFGLANPKLEVLNEQGQTTNLPINDPTGGGWELEESLDVEWAHAVAPSANIDLVEAGSTSMADLSWAVDTASHLSGVSVVSMSWGFAAFSGETSFDSDFNVPGVTFVAATGDNGLSGTYPSESPFVVAVGGTSLNLTYDATIYGSESAWIDSNGGLSPYEARPVFQNGVESVVGSKRGTPDVAFDANISTGVVICDSAAVSTYGSAWIPVGGTSIGAPSWAGIIAIADQGRAEEKLAPLSSSQTLTALYSLPAADFHDVTSGRNNGYLARAGYDLVTGLGTPVANLLLPGLVAQPASAATEGTSTAKTTESASKSVVAAVDGPISWSVDLGADTGPNGAGVDGFMPEGWTMGDPAMAYAVSVDGTTEATTVTDSGLTESVEGADTAVLNGYRERKKGFADSDDV